MRCVACKICEVECPPQCIYIVMDRDEKGKPQQRPKVFDIDISVCMQCQICVEVCPFDAIKMDNDYEKSQYDRFDDLVEHLPDLLKSNEYYNRIKPTEATAIDAKLKAEKEKKAKKAAPAARNRRTAPSPPHAAPKPAPVRCCRRRPRNSRFRRTRRSHPSNVSGSADFSVPFPCWPPVAGHQAPAPASPAEAPAAAAPGSQKLRRQPERRRATGRGTTRAWACSNASIWPKPRRWPTS
jgi:NADH-quinone oxidoreductase subunit I